MNYRNYIFTALAMALLCGLLPHISTVYAQEPATAGSAPTDQPASTDEPETPGSVETAFTNSTPINITVGGPVNAGPYPSSINVSGFSGLIPFTPGAIKVTLNNLSHNRPSDLGIVLISPWGGAMLIQDGAGGPVASISNVTYTLSDTGAAQLPNGPWTTGVYKPASYFVGDSFPAPGPGTGYANPGPVLSGAFPATFASTFGGTNPNGTWNLYIRDFVNTAGGSFAGGWTLEITGGGTRHRAVLDFDGDNRTDDTCVHSSGGAFTWMKLGSTAGPSDQVWGVTGDEFVPEEFDGDGKTDVAVYRAGVFYILRSSSNTFQAVTFGGASDDPRITQDFDNDGLADPAVARNGAINIEFYVLRSSLGFTAASWGVPATDRSIRGDFDGDGRADYAVVRRGSSSSPIYFYVLPSGGGPMLAVPFGVPGVDIVVPGDFDADGKTDVAVFRNGPISGSQAIWYWLRSSDNIIAAQPWGTAGLDLPVPGDYDGDLQTDPVIWRPFSTGHFFHLASTAGFSVTGLGDPGDVPPGNTLQAR